MNILADESIDKQIVDSLRGAGFIVEYISEMEPGITDDTVLGLANLKRMILLTADKDFGELVFRLHHIMAGVVLIRLAGLSPTKKAEITASFFAQHLDELMESFAVITPMGIRIRRKSINPNPC